MAKNEANSLSKVSDEQLQKMFVAGLKVLGLTEDNLLDDGIIVSDDYVPPMIGGHQPESEELHAILSVILLVRKERDARTKKAKGAKAGK
jgi:hypothetical protein